jgi:hypothetical protein
MTELDPTDIWSWWRIAKDNPGLIGTDVLPIDAEDPRAGYYRVRPKTGNWEPVCIIPDEDGGNVLHAERSNRPWPANRMSDLWLWCCRNPVEYEDFLQALDGGGWADEPDLPIGTGAKEEVGDPLDALLIEFDSEASQARDILAKTITEKAVADRAAIMASRLLGIARRADKLHEIEKAPFLKAGRMVDDKWRDIRDQPAELAKRLKRGQESYLKELERIERERVAAAAREAARLRAEAEEASRRAERERLRAEAEAARVREAAVRAGREAAAKAQAEVDAEKRAKMEAEAELIRQATEAEAERLAEIAHREADAAEAEAGVAISGALAAGRDAVFHNPQAGRTGQKTKLVTRTYAVIEDDFALFQAVREHPMVKELLQKLADASAKIGMPLAGTRVEQERRAQ